MANKTSISYKDIFESLGEGIFVTDLKGTVEDINNEALKLLNKKRNEVIGKSSLHIFSNRNEVCLAFKKGSTTSIQCTSATRGGKIEKLSIQKKLIRSKKSTPLGFIGIISNKKTSTATPENETDILHSFVVEHAPIGMLACTREGIVDYANSAFQEISGNSAEALLGLNILNLQSYQESGVAEKITDLFSKKANSFTLDEIEYTSPLNNKTTTRKITGIPLKDNGSIVRVLLFIQDLTDIAEQKRSIAEENEDMKIFQDFSIEREMKMIELKEQVRELMDELER